jgi:hypothetical protein
MTTEMIIVNIEEDEMFNEMFLTGVGFENTSDIKPNMNFYNE